MDCLMKEFSVRQKIGNVIAENTRESVIAASFVTNAE